MKEVVDIFSAANIRVYFRTILFIIYVLQDTNGHFIITGSDIMYNIRRKRKSLSLFPVPMTILDGAKTPFAEI